VKEKEKEEKLLWLASSMSSEGDSGGSRYNPPISDAPLIRDDKPPQPLTITTIITRKR
jgi:hypothetical protein